MLQVRNNRADLRNAAPRAINGAYWEVKQQFSEIFGLINLPFIRLSR
jgi:hypothetical protein